MIYLIIPIKWYFLRSPSYNFVFGSNQKSYFNTKMGFIATQLQKAIPVKE